MVAGAELPRRKKKKRRKRRKRNLKSQMMTWALGSLTKDKNSTFVFMVPGSYLTF